MENTISTSNTAVVVPWHNRNQLLQFLSEWEVSEEDSRLVLSQDTDKSGCAVTKNRGIQMAISRGYEAVVILDDDCFPDQESIAYNSFSSFVARHVELLNEQAPVELSMEVTYPPSRGTPYLSRTVPMPVAAVMGFWTHIGDYDACSQLVHGARPMTFHRKPVFGRYFPLCGMNLSFRLSEWPWCRFVDVNRFDDIWQGWMWQKHATEQGQCFRLDGPMVRHSRQSNVWANLREEAKYLEASDTLWSFIAQLPAGLSYAELRKAIADSHPSLALMFSDPLIK